MAESVRLYCTKRFMLAGGSESGREEDLRVRFRDRIMNVGYRGACVIYGEGSRAASFSTEDVELEERSSNFSRDASSKVIAVAGRITFSLFSLQDG